MMTRRSWHTSLLNLKSVIFLLWLAVVGLSYRHGHLLSGWDNLHPEFNLPLNISRSFFGVWQEYQGVGLVAGMAHAADLPRQLILYIFSLLVPMSSIRFLWWALMLLTGPMGMISLCNVMVQQQKRPNFNPQIAGFVTASFYLLSLATLQFFSTPYEAFITFYGCLPWLLWSVLRIFQPSSGPGKWLLLTVVHFFAAASFYVQTLFIVYGMLLASFLLNEVISSRSKQSITRAIAALTLVIISQFFWLLPVGYFSLTKAQVAVTAKQNTSATQENIFLNESKGTASDVLRLGSYLLDYTDFNLESEENELLLPVWKQWYDSKTGRLTGLVIGIAALVGIAVATIQFSRWRLLMLIWTSLCFTMLMRKVFIFNTLYFLLEKTFPLFSQLFRTTFTKWAIPLLLVYSLGLGIVAAKVYDLVMPKFKTLKFAIPLIFLIVFAIGVFPVFRIGLLKQEMNVQQPPAYQKMFTFFKGEQSQSRIAHLPVQSFWGWNYYSWGYRGSGFLWYGVEQPILDRAFDVWSGENEGFYNEISTAVYGCPRINNQNSNNKNQSTTDVQNAEDDTSANARSLGYARDDKVTQCAQTVKRVLEKYDVTYVLLDESVVAPGRNHEILRHEETKAVMSLLGWEQVFEEPVVSEQRLVASGNQEAFTEPLLHVWKRTERTDNSSLDPSTSFQDDELSSSNSAHRTSFVWAPEKFTVVEADTSKVRKDVVYERVGNYVEVRSSELGAHKASNEISPNPKPQTYYPFADVYKEELTDITVTASGFAPDSISLKRTLQIQKDSVLRLPEIPQETQMPILVSSTLQESELLVELSLAITIEADAQKISLPPLGQYSFLLAKPMDRVLLQVGNNTWEIQSGSANKHLVQLQVGESVPIRLFDVTVSDVISLPQSITQTQVSQCWTRDGQVGLVEVSQQAASTQIRVADASGCVSYPLGIAKDNSLMKIGVAHRSEDGARPHFCVDALGGEYACEHDPVFSLEGASQQWATVERYVNASEGSEYFLDLTARPSDQINHEWTIAYQTPQVEIFDVLGEIQLESSAWERANRDALLGLAEGEQDLVVVVKSEPTLLSSMFTGSASNCDVFDRGEIQETQDSTGYRMQASNQGSMCAVASTETIPVNQSFMLRMQGENISGRSLKFYLSNWTSDRADLEYLLDKDVFDQVFGILSWPKLAGNGYSLNLETRSFDSAMSENVLSRADMYPLPVEWLAGITVETQGVEGNTPIRNELKIVRSQKFGTSHYVAEVESAGSGLLQLSQGFDAGWLGYEVDGVKCGAVCRLMPWWFGERLEHVKVNGWANGWMLGSEYGVGSAECEAGDDTCEANNENVNNPEPRTSNVVIVFWPQYLEWGGLLALGGLGIWLGVGLINERRNKKRP